MRYKKLLCSVILLLSIGITGVNAQKMIVKEKSGAKTEYSISNISKLEFSALNLKVSSKDGSSKNYLINNLGNINFKDTGTGINPEIANADNNEGFHIYPNPVKDYINVKMTSESLQGSVIEILSISGKVVYSKVLESYTNEYQINANFLPSGFYVCRANNGKTIKTVKFLKQ